MKPQAFQPGELRDEYDQIIRAGAYGKKTPFVNSDNNAILDYIMNNFDALYAQIPNGRAYVKSVNNITPDSNGNVTVNVGGGGGTGGTNITVDFTLDSTSSNAIANKAVYAALNNKLDKTGIAAYATRDSSGNIIKDTYAKKSEVSGMVKTVNNIAPDSNGNVTITVSGGTGGSITVDSALSSTSTNAIQNRIVQQEFTSVRAAIPTKVSQLTNDSGYLTQHQPLDDYAKKNTANKWSAQQSFKQVLLGDERYLSPEVSGTSNMPQMSVMHYIATGAFTLNLNKFSASLEARNSSVFTAYIESSADYPLTITNAGTLKYIGSASDVAITSAGLLLNILMTRDANDNVTSIVQASKLS